jgi:polysaccharide deacetylase 2 family uncharacterized protein YibQ
MIKKILLAVFTISILVAAALTAFKLGMPALKGRFNSRPAPSSEGHGATPAIAQAPGTIESNLIALCRELEVDSGSIASKRIIEEHVTEIRAKIPRGRPFEYITWYLSRASEGTAYRLTDCVISKKDQTGTITFTSPQQHQDPVRFIFTYGTRYFSKTGKIAFLLEDFGFEADQTTIDYLSFDKPLTIGLVPAKAKSDWTAKIAKNYHKEIVIELPMEPLVPLAAAYKVPMIMVNHAAPQIDAFIEAAAKSLPDFSGFSNLYGSRFLEDTRVTTIMLEDVKQHHAYFVDTRSTDKSVAPALALQTGVPCATVDFRIGKKTGERGIDSLVTSYIQYAQKMGTALVSSSPTPALIKVLKKRKDAFGHSGIELVYVSELAKK